MKGDITRNILRTLSEMRVEAVDCCTAVLVAGYGASASQIRRIEEELREGRLRQNLAPSSPEVHFLRNYRKLLSKLKGQGLIAERQTHGRTMFSISAKGKLRLDVLESQLARRMPITSYTSKPNGRPVIVSFDVPEKERHKRAWLREVLVRLGFNRVQQSVFVGTIKIPKELLGDIERLDILHCVEIFEVTKTGTLRSLT